MYKLTFKPSVIAASLLCLIGFAYAGELDPSTYEGKRYDVVKSEYLVKGWQVLSEQGREVPVYQGYPEITCGSGTMAICSVGFQNDKHAVAFIVEKLGDHIIVSGEY
ncbi:hypothetical protein L4C36_14800 [Photobacterium japonica]|uniref:hypothetical protein n=1 Tax=Photobacterium japonica TaxID=2910235 RepID=UPI003D0A1B6B